MRNVENHCVEKEQAAAMVMGLAPQWVGWLGKGSWKK